MEHRHARHASPQVPSVPESPSGGKAMERAGLVGAWLEAALRSERAAVAAQLEKRHAELVAGLEARLAGTTPPTTSSTLDFRETSSLPSPPSSNGATYRRKASPSSQPQDAGGLHHHHQTQPEVPAITNGCSPEFIEDRERQDTEPESVQDTVAERERKKRQSQMKRGISSMPQQSKGFPRSLEELSNNFYVNLFFTILIVANSFLMALEVQYHGIQIGYKLQYTGAIRDADEAWPDAEFVFLVMEYVFGGFFTFELVLHIVAQKSRFFCCAWNMFDFAIIFLWLTDATGALQLDMNPMILRVARLAKILRMVRVVKTLHALDALQLLVSSIRASLSVLIWSVVILTMVMVVYAMILNYMLVDFMRDLDQPMEARIKIYMYFGTFTRAMLTMLEVTLGNWVPVCRTVVEDVSEWYSGVFILYKLVVGFAVVKVITGVFMHETFKVASTDDDLMIIQKERLVEKHRKKMQALFAETDASGDGKLSQSEFREIMKDKRVKHWLSAMELEVRDADELFDLLDNPCDGDVTVSAEELVAGVSRLKGASRAMDMEKLMRTVSEMKTIQMKQVLGIGTGNGQGFGEMWKELGAVHLAVAAVQRHLEKLQPGQLFGDSARRHENLISPSQKTRSGKSLGPARAQSADARPQDLPPRRTLLDNPQYDDRRTWSIDGPGPQV